MREMVQSVFKTNRLKKNLLNEYFVVLKKFNY